MPPESQAPQDRLLPTRLLCQRYSVVDKTIDRWIARGILPTPTRINGMRYWRESELEQREREGMGARKPTDQPTAA